jgi:hypothetical protein
MSLSFGNTASHPSTPNYTFVRGVIETTYLKTPASTMINCGDLILLNTATAAIMSAAAWDTNLATTQADVQPVFVGVALDSKLASDTSTRPILIATKGVFSYPCAALGAAHQVGERVAADGDGTHNLYDQKLAIATSNFIGSLAEVAPSGATNMTVYLQGALTFGAIPAA